jgi:hypothetical protein
MLALVLADACLEKFGGDTIAAMRAAHERHGAEVRRYCGSS